MSIGMMDGPLHSGDQQFRPPRRWTQVIPNAGLYKALLDRITERAHIIETGSDSYRFRRTLETSWVATLGRRRTGYQRYPLRPQSNCVVCQASIWLVREPFSGWPSSRVERLCGGSSLTRSANTHGFLP
jgi:hypothetical protein